MLRRRLLSFPNCTADVVADRAAAGKGAEVQPVTTNDDERWPATSKCGRHRGEAADDEGWPATQKGGQHLGEVASRGYQMQGPPKRDSGVEAALRCASLAVLSWRSSSVVAWHSCLNRASAGSLRTELRATASLRT